MSAELLLGVLLGLFSTDHAPDDLTIVRWQMTNAAYYRNQTPDASGGERRVFQFKREEANDNGLARCAREREDEVQRGRPRSRWCLAFAEQLAPAFRFVLQSNAAGPVVIESLVVLVHDVEPLLAGRGFLEDEASYDVQIRPEEGTTQAIPFKKPLEFTGLGTIDLRLGFDLSAYGAKPPPLRIDLSLTFRRSNGDGEVETPVIRLEM